MEKLDRIIVNPSICLGQPTIQGTRITVSIILRQLGSGMTYNEILKAYPELKEEDIHQSIKYAAWLASEETRSLVGST